jgi:hypothetical protein
MSIYNLPPLTQTPEHMPGEVANVFDMTGLLGRESLGRVVYNPTFDNDGDVLYFPTHESLQAACSYIRETELAEVEGSIDEAKESLARINTELAMLAARLLAIEGYLDDLGLTGTAGAATKRFNGYSYIDTARLIGALEEAKNSMFEETDSLYEKRRHVIAELEAIEQKDFELLQSGR